MPFFFKRGSVFKVKFIPPDRPDQPIEKFVVCLQEGKIVAKTSSFVGLILTTLKPDKPRRKYPWEVLVSPNESRTQHGVAIICNQIHTIPKDWIIDYAYDLSVATMEEVDQKVLFGVGLVKIEELE